MLSVAVTPYERVRESLEAHGHPVRNGSARCPAHDDHSPSLSLSEGRDGRAVIHCHTGCTTDAVLAALDLTMTDLFPAKVNGHGPLPAVVARYPYTDELGELLYTVERYEPGFEGARKSFAQRPANGRKGKGAMEGTRLVLYRLPKVIDAVANGRTILIVEGEKDVEAAERAGWTATCNPTGALKWGKVVDAAHYLTGAKVIVVADADETGYRHARQVVASIIDVAASVVVGEAAHGKDLSDHLASGFTVEELDLIAGNGVDGVPTVAEWLSETPVEAQETSDEDEAPDDAEDEDSWLPVDLGPVLAGEVEQPAPDIMIRHDGKAMIYERAVNYLHGASGDGKGWLVCDTIHRQAMRGYSTILIDLEDIPQSITARLIEMGMSHELIAKHLIYIRPQTGFTRPVVDRLIELIHERDVRFLVVDSIGEAFAIEGVDEDKDKEVGPWIRAVARRLADAGPAVLLVDHSTKANDNPLFPSGSKRKRAAVTGAGYYAEALKPFVKGEGGRMRLTCAKDRHGNYRRGETAAFLVMTYSAGGALKLELYAPSLSDGKADDPRAVIVARAAVRAAKAEGKALSREALTGLIKAEAGTDLKRAGIDIAVSRGALSETSGPRKARLFTYVKDLPENPDD